MSPTERSKHSMAPCRISHEYFITHKIKRTDELGRKHKRDMTTVQLVKCHDNMTSIPRKSQCKSVWSENNCYRYNADWRAV
eukprot:scaffold233159_cov17-Prasinocladus_malaysianus.AAC.1